MQQRHVYATQIDELARAPQEEQVAAAGLRTQWQIKIQDLLSRRGRVLGDTLRLRGGQVAADGTIDCALTLQLRLPATLGNVQATVEHDPADFELIGHVAGQHVPTTSVFVQANAGSSSVVLAQNVSQSTTWAAGEYELTKLQFRLKNPEAKPIFYIHLTDARITHDGSEQPFRTLHATVFGS